MFNIKRSINQKRIFSALPPMLMQHIFLYWFDSKTMRYLFTVFDYNSTPPRINIINLVTLVLKNNLQKVFEWRFKFELVDFFPSLMLSRFI